MSTLAPGSPEWSARVTASKVAGILGLSPWDSPLSTWHLMAGNLPSAAMTEAMARGHYLESGCLAWWADRGDGLRSIVGTQVQQHLGDWGAATPDATAYDGEEFVLVDAKTTSDYEWLEVPAHYVASSLWQLACFPEAVRVHLAVLHGGLRFREYVVDRDEATIAGLVDTCRTFYDTVQAGQEPLGLSAMACDYEVLRTVHPEIDRDAVAILPDELVDAYLLDAAHEKRAAATKAAVLAAMGSARIARSTSGQDIARRQPKGDAVTLVRVAAPIDIESETAA